MSTPQVLKPNWLEYPKSVPEFSGHYIVSVAGSWPSIQIASWIFHTMGDGSGYWQMPESAYVLAWTPDTIEPYMEKI